MLAQMRMKHEKDPAQTIWDSLGGNVDELELAPAKVLIAIYERPEMTAGGIHLPGKTRGEDVYQGKVGLIIKMGPNCFEDDAIHTFGGFSPKIGDWVLFTAAEGRQLGLPSATVTTGTPCRIFEDTAILGKISSPDYIF